MDDTTVALVASAQRRPSKDGSVSTRLPEARAGARVGTWGLVARILVTACLLVWFVSLGGEAAVHGQTDSPRLDRRSAPVRIRIASLGIDLPVVSSRYAVAGNPAGYPLCDVAQFWTRFALPGAPGTTWIYAHAQPGMFLPLFEVADATAGRGLIGKDVTLQLEDGRLLRYRIDEVRQHARGTSIASRAGKREHRLVLQTSEGPPGTVPKLQVAARLVGAAGAADAPPEPRPRACASGRPSGPAGSSKAAPAETPALSGTHDKRPRDGDPVSLALGGGAMLAGSTILAFVLVRRRL